MCVRSVRFGWFHIYALLFLHARTSRCPLQHLPLAPGHVFGYQEHTQSVGFAPFGLCVINDNVGLQHAQHDAQNVLH